jgi:hypothetical protein
MLIKVVRVLRVLCIPVLLLSLGHAKAAEPVTFAGSYHISNVVKDATGVHFTMTLKLINSRNEDIRGGIVAMLDSSPHGELLGSFSAIKVLPRLGQTEVVHKFTISEAEYARWQQGKEPILQFLVPGEDGAIAARIQAPRDIAPAEQIN